jgi:hypothetical protein
MHLEYVSKGISLSVLSFLAARPSLQINGKGTLWPADRTGGAGFDMRRRLTIQKLASDKRIQGHEWQQMITAAAVTECLNSVTDCIQGDNKFRQVRAAILYESCILEFWCN